MITQSTTKQRELSELWKKKLLTMFSETEKGSIDWSRRQDNTYRLFSYALLSTPAANRLYICVFWAAVPTYALMPFAAAICFRNA